MQTRAAAKLASAAATASNVVGVSDRHAEVVQALGSTGDPEMIAHSKTSGKTTKASTKRKRGGKQQAQPLKGGWVLPHGMGVAGLGTESELVDAASDPDLPAQQSATVTSQLKLNTQKKVLRQTRQTRLSLRVTKARVKEEKVQEPIVKLEEPDDASNVEQEDGHPNKRVRTALVANISADAPVANKVASDLALLKVEKKKILDQPTPKVLIIKGITIKDDIVTKSSAKIVIDASQLLDPNFRRIVKRGKENPYGLTPGFSPYSYRRVPTLDSCKEVHRILTEIHGEVKQPDKMPLASLEVAGCGEVPCVLDALLRTLISGNTLMALADAAIKNLAEHYGLRQDGTGAGSINWDKVRLSTHGELAQVIKVAGNGPNRSQHIKRILDMVHEENIQRANTQPPSTEADENQAVVEAEKTTHNLLSLDHMHAMSKDEAMAKFVSYPGIGIKTAACVTLFCLRMPCFAVDTHVHKFCRWLGWVPDKADPDNCFRHGDFMVPDHLKYGLHQLFIRHGQLCFKCRKATKPGTKDWNEAPDCPLEHLLVRSKDEAGSKPKKVKKVKEETSSQTDTSKSEDASEEEEEEE
ncbi:DNA glycosylase [Chaetomium fimeti]|uniref:DNA glycosylase n=1 Tax=Chaetomium fimeti TaxID=1854472 RepID=A0AAE0LVD8_9PEZI|nr:DNA glycosylase [Chaetomium fimeti]